MNIIFCINSSLENMNHLRPVVGAVEGALQVYRFKEIHVCLFQFV